MLFTNFFYLVGAKLRKKTAQGGCGWGRGGGSTPANSHMLTGAITVSYPDCAVGSVDNEGGEREMCKAAFHYEIVCITVIQRASCSLWRVPDSWVGNLRDSGEAQLISGHIWHGLYGCYKN